MKKTLLISALLIQILIKAQLQIDVYKVTPSTACAGDSVKINFKIISCTSTGSFQIIPSMNILFSAGCLQMGNYPTETIPFYGLCSYKKIKLTNGLSSGLYTIRGSGQPLTTYNNTITISSCATEIQELNIDLNVTPVYFDLNGNRINKKTNELIIEQIGLIRKKVFIFN